jgi:hypothetical protein
MLTRLSAMLAGSGSWSFLASSTTPPLPASFLGGILAPIAVLAIVVMAIGFLFLVGRLSWAAHEFVITCRERQRAHRKLVEMLHDHLENEQLGVDQLWSASSALSAC